MTDEAKKTISELRIQGLGYKKIAKETDLNAGTVKSYCIRHGLGRGALPVKPNMLPTKPCDYCGGVVTLYPGRKVPRFCCSACRIKWWNRHLSESNHGCILKYECPACGKVFRAYEKRHRKYCSHSCYITARFG